MFQLLTLSIALSMSPSASAADLRSGFVLVANQQSASVSLINLEDDSAKVIAVGAGPHEAVISPGGHTGIVTIYGVAGAPGNELAVVDIATGVVTKTISLGQYTRAFTSNVTGNSVSDVDLKSQKTVRVVQVGPGIEGIAAVPDGSAVWAGSNGAGTVSIIDTRTGTIAQTLTGFGMPYRLAMSADGKIAIICDPKGDKLHVADVVQRNAQGQGREVARRRVVRASSKVSAVEADGPLYSTGRRMRRA